MNLPSPHHQIEQLWKNAPATGSLRVAALGDSLTYGWSASAGYFERYLDRVRQQYPHVSIVGYNAGVCGDTAEDGWRRLPPILAQSFNLLLIEFGINDLYCGVPVQRYQDFLAAIVGKTRESGSIPLLITSGPLLYPEQQHDIAPYYEALHGVATQLDCPVADIAKVFAHRYTSFHDFYFEDGVHPNDAGYSAMADALLQLCNPL